MSYTYSVFYGSVRSEREGIKAAVFIKKQLEKRGHRVHFIDAAEYKLPLLDKMYKEYKKGEAPKTMEKIAGWLKESEGFVMVTGEYNHSIPPALKNLLDHFQTEYYFKPSAIVSYSAGMFSGVRAAVHLRSVVGELGMPAISSMLPVPKVQDNFNTEGETENEIIKKSASRFLDELEWYTEAFNNQRVKGTPY